MEEEQKPRPWLTWLVVGLVLLVAYPFSLGPYLFLVVNGFVSEPVHAFVIDVIYRPLLSTEQDFPRPVLEFLLWHRAWCYEY